MAAHTATMEENTHIKKNIDDIATSIIHPTFLLHIVLPLMWIWPPDLSILFLRLGQVA